jgi:RNA polymerase sigma-70 factor (ECF subfamily)
VLTTLGRVRTVALVRVADDQYGRGVVRGPDGGAAEAAEAEGAPAASVAEVRFAASAREHERVLVIIAARLCRDEADAKDLVQDTFERALRAWERLPEDANVRAWLVTILHRLFIDRCRRAKRGVVVAMDRDVPGAEPVPPPVWADVTQEQVTEAVAQLDDDFRRVYELHAIDGKSYKEIAEALAIPASTVGTRLLRARRRLKELIVAQLATAPGAIDAEGAP